MKKPDNEIFLLQKLVVGMARIDRNHYLAKTERRENDIEHSFSVALLCWYVLTKHKLPLDFGKVMKYAMAHDFVEVYAGDVNSFASESERAEKIKTERGALERLSKEFIGFSDLVMIMQDYEIKKDDEAMFVWTVDKMQALLMGDLDDWRPYIELKIDYEWFSAKYAELLEKASPYAKEIFNSFIEYSKTTYYSRPKS